MSEQPEALRLAGALDDFCSKDCCSQRPKAAAELRRQHAEIESLRREQEEDQCAIRVWRRRADQAEAKSDALLEALKKIAAIENKMWGTDWEEISEARDIARAAIKAVEGENT